MVAHAGAPYIGPGCCADAISDESGEAPMIATALIGL